MSFPQLPRASAKNFWIIQYLSSQSMISIFSHPITEKVTNPFLLSFTTSTLVQPSSPAWTMVATSSLRILHKPHGHFPSWQPQRSCSHPSDISPSSTHNLPLASTLHRIEDKVIARAHTVWPHGLSSSFPQSLLFILASCCSSNVPVRFLP